MIEQDHYVRARSKKQIEQEAAAWRYAFGVVDNWVVPIIDILEHEIPKLLPEYSLRVVGVDDMPDRYGHTSFAPPEITLREDVYLGAYKGNGRNRFTAAHELGHLVLFTGQTSARMVAQTGTRKKTYMSGESQANQFAASFLVPEHVARQFNNPEELAECCKISLQAAQYRLRDLGLSRKGRELPQSVIDFLEQARKLPRRPI